jgi:hypothetical protein
MRAFASHQRHFLLRFDLIRLGFQFEIAQIVHAFALKSHRGLGIALTVRNRAVSSKTMSFCLTIWRSWIRNRSRIKIRLRFVLSLGKHLTNKVLLNYLNVVVL